MLEEKNPNATTEPNENQKYGVLRSMSIMNKLSRSARKFFRLFLWKMIYLASQKNLKNISEENALENLIKELQKPKLQEILAKGRKIFIHIPDGKDVHVFKIILIKIKLKMLFL